jgi:tight adherence protein B
MAVLTGSRLARQSSLARRRRVVLTELSAAMRALVREIRAGASVAQACARVAATAGPATGGVWESLAGELGFGIASPDMAPRPGDGGPADELAVVTDRLRAALRLSARRGVPPVDLVAACAADVEATAAMLDRQAAEVAGPRLSGYLLAALPVLGLLLGTGMGADPVAVLVSTGLGQVLLVVGVGLSCAGLRWIARIVR